MTAQELIEYIDELVNDYEIDFITAKAKHEALLELRNNIKNTINESND